MRTVKMANYAPRPDLLTGRVVLVTGAGAGIGRAISLSYAQHGATVVLLGRTVRKLEAVYDEIGAANGPEPAIYPMDLAGATTQDYEELAERVGDQLGRLDGLVHNASLLGTLCPLEQCNPEHWIMVMQVNVNAPFQLTRATLPLLKQAPDASIIFTSAGVGRAGRAFWGAYSVSKFATEGMMQVLADEVENLASLRVNSINPGAVRTTMRASAYPGENPMTLHPPEDVVGVYLHLMGPDGAGTHGQSIDAQHRAHAARG